MFWGNQEALKFKGTLQLFVYAVCVDLSCQNLKYCEIKQAAVLVACKEVGGLDVMPINLARRSCLVTIMQDKNTI